MIGLVILSGERALRRPFSFICQHDVKSIHLDVLSENAAAMRRVRLPDGMNMGGLTLSSC